MASFGERVKRSWNVFMGRDPTKVPNDFTVPYVIGTSYRPDRIQMSTNNIRSVVASIYNKIAVDISLIDIRQVRLNDDGKFEEFMDTTLNRCLSLDPNKDQTSRGLIRDIVQSMFDEGCVAVIPYETDNDPEESNSFKILAIRTAKILAWYPDYIRVEMYDDRVNQRKEIVVEKRLAAIIENPFYSTMNEPNSIAQRLIRTLNQLDRLNAESNSGRLDLIIQLPYALKGDLRIEQGEKRRKEIEAQLVNSQHGIAYIDGTEKVIQLNRSVENKLWEQAKDLQSQLYSQMGFSEAILNGTADEMTMLNYHNHTLEPILNEIVESMQKKWLTQTAISQKQAIRYFRDPFKLVPVMQLAENADKLTRNEIMTSNEFRSILGLKPSKDPNADKLRNANLNHPDETGQATRSESVDEEKT